MTPERRAKVVEALRAAAAICDRGDQRLADKALTDASERIGCVDDLFDEINANEERRPFYGHPAEKAASCRALASEIEAAS